MCIFSKKNFSWTIQNYILEVTQPTVHSLANIATNHTKMLHRYILTFKLIIPQVRNVPERNSTSSVQRSIFTPTLIILFFFLIAKRSHLCSECGASFMKSDHLKRHINSTHRKIKTIKCGFCDMMFSDKYKAKVCMNDIQVGNFQK